MYVLKFECYIIDPLFLPPILFATKAIVEAARITTLNLEPS